MGKKDSKEKWYVVKIGTNKYSAHIFNDFRQASSFAKSKNTVCKKCVDKGSAIAYAGCKESKICFHLYNPPKAPTKICLVCEKPFKGKTKLCPTCNKLRGSMSVTTAVALKAIYPDDDIFKLIQREPYIVSMVTRRMAKHERSAMRQYRGALLNSSAYKNVQHSKTDMHIPDYVAALFDRDKTKELLYIEGDKLNPFIYYTCKKCGLEQCQQYEKLKTSAGHNCIAVKSSGEVIIEAYLREIGVQFNTQFETLKCVNPKTQRVMPYDFELRNRSIIIEVQGEQHLAYIPYFHGSEENFRYQVWKDRYKRDYAIRKGYDVLYITYYDIEKGTYRAMIDDLISKKEK